MSMTDISTPLTPAVFYILLSLANGEKHGYEIMKQVREDSNNKVKMGNGTLYGSLKRMLADNLIEDAGVKEEVDDERRKYYRLTDKGRKFLSDEMQRYVETVKVIQRRVCLRAYPSEL
jgi:DNA-binding PadR family transcriptional regulator